MNKVYLPGLLLAALVLGMQPCGAQYRQDTASMAAPGTDTSARSGPAADTSLFFDPIFAEHGYTFEDYDATLKYYTARPEIFSELMTRVSDRLSAMGGELVERGNEHAMIIRENRLNEADYRPYGFDPAALPLEFLRIYDSVHTAPPLVDLPEAADTSETVKAVLPADGTQKPGVLQVRKELKD